MSRFKPLVDKHTFVRTDDPDTILVMWDIERDPDDPGEEYHVIQTGIWWWKKYVIAYAVADCAAGGINSGIWWKEVSQPFKSRDEARAALYAGKFRYKL